MELKTFLETFADAVAQDSDLTSWLQVNFSRSLTLIVDLPSDNFPDIEDDYPFVVLLPSEKSSAQQQRYIDYGLDIWLGISTETYVTRADGATEPSGVALICDFIEKVKTAVVDGLPANTWVSFVEAIDTLGRPPEVQGFIEMNFRLNSIVTGKHRSRC